MYETSLVGWAAAGNSDADKAETEAKAAALKASIAECDRKLLPDGDVDIKALELQAAEFGEAMSGEIVKALEAMAEEKKAIYDKAGLRKELVCAAGSCHTNAKRDSQYVPCN